MARAINILRKQNAAEMALADLAMRTANWNAVVGYCRQILKRDHSHLPAMEMLAKALWRLQAYAELLSTVRALVALNPYEPSYHSLLGTTLQCLGRFNEAAAAFERAGDDEQIRDLRAAIETWHANSVAELNRTDVVFRADFNRNPQEACRKRGITIVKNDDGDFIPLQATDRLRASIRMS